MAAYVESEATEDGVPEDNTDHQRPQVDFARPCKNQQYDDDGEPVPSPPVGVNNGNKRKRNEGFRLAGRRVFLTYAGLPKGEFSLIEVHNKVKALCKGGCTEIITCKEKHPDPADPEKDEHFHVYAMGNNRFDTTSWEYFALTSDKTGKQHYGHVQTAGSTRGDRARMIHYIRKDGITIQELEGDIDSNLLGDIDRTSMWQELAETKDIATAMEDLRKKRPRVWLLQGQRIQQSLRAAHVELSPAACSPTCPFFLCVHSRQSF